MASRTPYRKLFALDQECWTILANCRKLKQSDYVRRAIKHYDHWLNSDWEGAIPMEHNNIHMEYHTNNLKLRFQELESELEETQIRGIRRLREIEGLKKKLSTLQERRKWWQFWK